MGAPDLNPWLFLRIGALLGVFLLIRALIPGFVVGLRFFETSPWLHPPRKSWKGEHGFFAAVPSKNMAMSLIR